MKVSLIQSNPGSDKAANLAEAKALMERAIALDSPDFVMLPEVFDWMGSPGPDKTQAAEAERDGPSYRMCQSIAREHKVWVHAGSFRTTIAGEDRCHNTTVVFNRDGREVARYHKIHLFDITSPDGASYRESATFKPGDNIVTYECEGITVGCAICYDVRFPELFQALVKRGAQIITLPAAFTLQTGMDHWEVLCRARAIEHVFVAVAARPGAHALQVGAGARLGHRDRADQFAGDHARQEALLLVFGAAVEQVGRDDGRVQAAAVAAEVGPCRLQDDHRVMAEVTATTAVFGRRRQAQQALGAGFVPGLARHAPGFAPSRRLRHPALLEEARHRVLQRVVLLGHPGRREIGQGHGVSVTWRRVACARPG